MKMLRNPRMTFSQVSNEVGISVPSVCRIFDKYAGVTPIGMPKCLCIDEIYAIKYKQKIYACVLVDMQTSQVYDLLPTRRKADLSSYFSRISQEERDKVKYICMDMFQLYKDVAEVYFPCAKICIDSFHVIQQVNNAFNNIRVRVMKSFETTSENTEAAQTIQLGPYEEILPESIFMNRSICVNTTTVSTVSMSLQGS